MRIEVYFRDSLWDGRALRLREELSSRAATVGLDRIEALRSVDVYIAAESPRDDAPEPSGFRGLAAEKAAGLFCDPVAERACVDTPAADAMTDFSWDWAVEITYRAAVTDPVKMTMKSTLETALDEVLPEGVVLQRARQYLFRGGGAGPADWKRLAAGLHNPLIEKATIISAEEWRAGKRFPSLYPHRVTASSQDIATFSLTGMSGEELRDFSRKKLLALTAEEMKVIQAYYDNPAVQETRRSRGLPAEATDVELEMLAQTWSEHCKHKIMNARVRYRDRETGADEVVENLFKEYIRGTTDEVSRSKDYLKSVFHDNSGVIDFDDDHLVCFKVETHNSPSALDPYGGAITGIVGVNRDILGTGKGARPIFNTNVLCFGDVQAPPESIPEGLLHPREIMKGVHKGIVDGGNQSGIPVAGGAFLFDDSYTGKPLVFCGTGGILPREIDGEGAWIKHIDAGDTAVMLGGRIGKDGIHGATFSSLALDEESPTSAVQIGDPITQKKMSDFLMEARDRGLYKGITDNGAGGLSSSLGEMAELSGGIRIELDRCPLKYAGLAPWEILVSESQERMSLSVDPHRLDEFMALARQRDVEASEVGTFTDSGYIEIYYRGEPAALLDIDFLHDGLPQMDLEAQWIPPERPERSLQEALAGQGLKPCLTGLLRDPNIASKEPWIRQYDHEVQALSVTKPMTGIRQDSPSDGGVLMPVAGSLQGLTVTHGICPRYGDIDTYQMALNAVDEAFRAHVACGGNPERTAALDNFCWPDPVATAENPDGAYRMAQMVRACRGLKEACLAYGTPLISGKDSMKNEARIGGRVIPVRPTLLVSLMGICDNVEETVSTDFKQEGDLLFLLGETRSELAGSALERHLGVPLEKVPSVEPERAMELYRALHRAIEGGLVASCHDLSEGGLAVAAAESALGGRLGCTLDLDHPASLSPAEILFSESPSRFLVSIAPASAASFEAVMQGRPCRQVGVVTGGELLCRREGAPVLAMALDEIEESWKSFR